MKEPDILSGLLPEEILQILEYGQSFRGKQIFQWIGKGVTSFDSMTNLSKELRTFLIDKTQIYSTEIAKKLDDPDGTIKLQIQLKDGYMIETVLLIDAEGRKTACVSSQAGCAIRCAFCKTGQMGFARNLDSGEIVEQFFHLENIAGKLDNIVFMGMGEPLLNLSAVRKAIGILTHPEGRNLSSKKITISTSGIIKGIYDLADSVPKIRLAISLTTADPQLRTMLMPVNQTNPLPELKQAIAYFTEKTGDRCTLEAALLANTNTTEQSARELIAFAQGLNVHINLIPWNPVENMPFKEPSSRETGLFIKKLEQAGLNVTLRTRRGRKIGGACGQLGAITNTEQKHSI